MTWFDDGGNEPPHEPPPSSRWRVVSVTRYYDSYAADGYYLSRRPPGERPVTTSYPARGERAQPSCPACYRPGHRPGYLRAV